MRTDMLICILFIISTTQCVKTCLKGDTEVKNDLDDSGIGQNESLTMKKQQSIETQNGIQLLDLSDDVLLYVLKHCTPRDLKALGFTCSRLGTLVLDRTLWERVDARDQPVGMKRLRWLLKYAICSSTSELLLSGYAKDVEGCLGILNSICSNDSMIISDDSDEWRSEDVIRPPEAEAADGNVTDEPVRRGIIRGGPVVQIYESMPMIQPHIPTLSVVNKRVPKKIRRYIPSNDECPGPRFTLTNAHLVKLGMLCPNLTSLALEYCNLDCATTSIKQFPKTLKVLSLRGSKCYSQSYEKIFLFKIQDNLKLLEELNVSECEWVEPSSLFPLSKLPALRRLYMRSCCKMCECVAYSSLATRYGFNALQVLDLRESPVSDSEVSSFGWVASLEELYLSPAPKTKPCSRHGHDVSEDIPRNRELEPWEELEPEYMYKLRKTECFNDDDDDDDPRESCRNTINSLKRRRMNYPRDSYEDALDYAINGQMLPQFDPPDENGTNGAKRSRQNGVNEGASTSGAPRSSQEPSTSNGPSVSNNGEEKPDSEKQDLPSFSLNNDEFMADESADDGNKTKTQGHLEKVLFVNVCRKIQTMYRLSMPVYMVDEPANIGRFGTTRRLNISNEPFAPQLLDPTTLVSDASIHRFGRADTDNVNYINIGPNGIQRDHRASRPDRSNLRVLYVRGFRNVTNRSLVHLATAAPRLTLLDVTDTRVNERGVENFKSLRPDCEVVFTKCEVE